MYNENINTVWHRKLCMKVATHQKSEKSKITDFSWMIFWVQTVSIPPDQNILIPFDQNVLILLVSNIHNSNFETFFA